MDSDAATAASENLWAHPVAPWLVWGGLIAAFSPVLRELVQHWVDHPWARVSIIFPWLAWVAVRKDQGRPGKASRRIIWACLITALIIEMIAITGDTIRFARIALAIGGAGVIAGAGWARLTASIVLAFSVPPPNALLKIFSPGLENAFGKLVAALVPTLRFERVGLRFHWLTENADLLLEHTHGGLAMGIGLAGLGWFQTVVTGGEWKDAIKRAVIWFLWMIPIQLVLFMGAAGLMVVSGQANGALWLLNQMGWIIVMASGAFLSVQALRVSGGPGGLARTSVEAVPC